MVLNPTDSKSVSIRAFVYSGDSPAFFQKFENFQRVILLDCREKWLFPEIKQWLAEI